MGRNSGGGGGGGGAAASNPTNAAGVASNASRAAHQQAVSAGATHMAVNPFTGATQYYRKKNGQLQVASIQSDGSLGKWNDDPYQSMPSLANPILSNTTPNAPHDPISNPFLR